MREGPVIQCAQCGSAIVAPEWSECIDPSAVFGTYGPAKRADTSLKIRSISPHLEFSPI